MVEHWHMRTEDLHYLSASPAGDVSAQASWPEKRETFEIVPVEEPAGPVLDGDLVQIQTRDGRLLGHADGRLHACAPTRGEALFRIELCGEPTLQDATHFRLLTPFGRRPPWPLPAQAERRVGMGSAVAALPAARALPRRARPGPGAPLARHRGPRAPQRPARTGERGARNAAGGRLGRAQPAHGDIEEAPTRTRLEQFINPDDRADFERLGRTTVSMHEVVDTGLRLRLLDHDQQGELQFRHRIMQAYLAACRLLDRDRDHDAEAVASHGAPTGHDRPGRFRADLAARVDDLVDRHHPEKLTCQMTLTFAAIRAHERAPSDPRQDKAYRAIMERLLQEGGATEQDEPADPGSASTDSPGVLPDPETRTDPDNRLVMLTTAARIARVTDAVERYAAPIIRAVELAHGATRWTKIDAIGAIAGLDGAPDRWRRIWEFARDPDYRVRRAACEAIQSDAADAYEALRMSITELIIRAAARHELAHPLTEAATGWKPTHGSGEAEPLAVDDDMMSLEALGWILPAIVSGMRELPADWTGSPDEERHDAYVREARHALEWLVALAFESGNDGFEAAIAQGFKDDAMRHAEDPTGRIGGPGRVAANRQLVTEIGLVHARSWYARMLLHQALALYTIAGAERQEALDLISWYLDAGRESHPFVRRAAELAR